MGSSAGGKGVTSHKPSGIARSRSDVGAPLPVDGNAGHGGVRVKGLSDRRNARWRTIAAVQRAAERTKRARTMLAAIVRRRQWNAATRFSRCREAASKMMLRTR